jgi:serine/threonine protein kinase
MLVGMGYDTSMDWWSVGVLMFHCLASDTPFNGSHNDQTDVTTDDSDRLQSNILSGKIDWSLIPSEVSTSSRNLISSLLATNPKNRLVGTNVLAHEFFSSLPVIGPQMFVEEKGPLYDLVQEDMKRNESRYESITAESRSSQAAQDYKALLRDSIECVPNEFESTEKINKSNNVFSSFSFEESFRVSS